VSLYNETDGKGIMPTPTIGGVGLIDDHARVLTVRPEAGNVLVLLGESRGHMGQSALLAALFDRAEGPVPPVDFAAEAAAGALVQRLAAGRLATAAHDLSDGGLAVAAAEMALAAGVGVALEAPKALTPLAFFFGEDQGRYLVACAPEGLAAVLAEATKAGVAARAVGVVEGDSVALGDSAVPLAALAEAHGQGFALLMGEAG
jgi:phosphoribosylformylglycinamidine synthase